MFTLGGKLVIKRRIRTNKLQQFMERDEWIRKAAKQTFPAHRHMTTRNVKNCKRIYCKFEWHGANRMCAHSSF